MQTFKQLLEYRDTAQRNYWAASDALVAAERLPSGSSDRPAAIKRAEYALKVTSRVYSQATDAVMTSAQAAAREVV